MAPDADPCTHCLDETPLLDFSHPRLQVCARRLARPGLTPRERALTLHSFVRLIPFSAASPTARPAPASVVLREGRGDAWAKGVLFVALCRAAGIAARLHVLRLRCDPLRGLRSGRHASADHPVSQVRLDGRWLTTDAYLLDPLLFELARRRWAQEGMGGWGLRPDAPTLWQGHEDCLQQFSPQDVMLDLGVFDDPPAHSFEAPGRAQRALLARMRDWVHRGGGRNRKLQQVRDAPPATARRSSPA